ncbi:MAG: acyltransferase [Lachnospiraceae bacterium]|nr:acyltransferase [Lachnospiraceae bacterium]
MKNLACNGSVKQKDTFWQAVRGVCILAVIMIHCPKGTSFAVESMEFSLWILIRQCIIFPVALFVFFAGYFTNTDTIQKNYRSYITSRAGRLIKPFLVWSVFYSLLTILRTAAKGNDIDWIVIACRFFTGKSSAQLYYILVLLQLNFLSPLLIKAIQKNGIAYKLLWLVTPLYLVYVYCWNIVFHEMPILYATVFPAWFVFYYIGLTLRLKGQEWTRKLLRFGNLYFVFFAFLLGLIETAILIKLDSNIEFFTTQIRFTCFLYAGGIALFLYNKKQRNKTPKHCGILKAFGNYSYGIYYLHYVVLMVVEKGLCAFSVQKVWLLYFVLTWVLTSAISYVCVLCGNKIAGAKGSKLGKTVLEWVGFR